MPSRSVSARSSSWSRIEPAAADEPKSERPKRAPSSSAQETSRTVTGGSPSAAIRRSTSTPASTFRQPSSQPPFGTESMWPPMHERRGRRRPRSVNHWLPASSISSTAPVPSSFAAQERPRLLPRRPSRRRAGRRSRRRSARAALRDRRRCGRDRAPWRRGYNGARTVIFTRPWLRPAMRRRSGTNAEPRAFARAHSVRARPRRIVVLMLLVLWGLWELYRWIWVRDRLDVAVPGQRHDDPAHPHDLQGARRAGAARRARC